MRSDLKAALWLLLLFTLLCGVVYPLAVTAVARVAFPERSGGSLLYRDGRVVGSRLIGQEFESPRYFWGRPSATASGPYDAGASGGSNLGPGHPALLATVRKRIEALRAASGGAVGPVPVDLVTASGSGLDPHVSPAAAAFQIERVARARGLPEARVRDLVASAIEPRSLWILGEPRVNVLRLNLALDAVSDSIGAARGADPR